MFKLSRAPVSLRAFSLMLLGSGVYIVLGGGGESLKVQTSNAGSTGD